MAAFSRRLPIVIVMILLMSFGNQLVYSVITDVQLFGGPTCNKGTVEIREDGSAWETTCGLNLVISDVIVICRQLGFTGASRAIENTPYGQNSIPTTLLSCNGDEDDLSECLLLHVPCSSTVAGAASCHGEGYLGCFRDNANDRVLPGDYVRDYRNMTISYCIQFCISSISANYTYAGVEYAHECYCGEARVNYTRHGVGSDDNCNYQCAGDPTERCGAIGYIAIFNIHVETVETTPAVVPTDEKVHYTKDAVTSFLLTTPLSTPTTLQQSGHSSCVGVGVGEGVVIIILIATIIVMYILRNRKMKKDSHSQNSNDMTLVQASSSPDKDTGIYHDIQDIRTPVPSSSPAGGSHYSSNIYDQKRRHATDSADTGLPTESTHYSTRIEKD